MQSKLENTLPKLEKLKKYLTDSSYSRIYLLCGNEKAGKNTLCHYIIEADIVYGCDEEGQDVLTIQNQSETITIVENVLQVMPCVDQSILFIKLIGFLGENKTQQQKEQYAITLDYLLNLLTQVTERSIKFIFILSLLQIEQDNQIFSKYYRCFKSVKDYVQRSHIVLSKLYDDDQFNEFVEIKSQDIIQSMENCQFINQIIQDSRIYGFYCRDVDPDERYQFNQKINGTYVQDKFQLVEKGQLLREIIHQSGSDLHHLADHYNGQLKTCLHILDASIVGLLYKGCKIEDDPQFIKIEKESYKKIYGSEHRNEYNQTIGDKKAFEAYVKVYEQLFKIAKTTPQQLVPLLLEKLDYLLKHFSQKIEQNNFISRIQILVLVCNAMSEKGQFLFLKNPQFFNLFTNHENGAFQDHYLAKAFSKIKPLLSAQFAKANQKLGSSSPQKKKIIKKKPTNTIPNFDEQKKSFLAKPKKISQILQLLPSPLKIDLLIEQLQKMRKNKSRNILQQKSLIKQLVKVLQIYNRYEEAVRYSWVVPDFFAMQKYLVKYIESFGNSDNDISEKQGKIINDVCLFFFEVRRIQYLINIQTSLKALEQKLQQSPKPKPAKKITQYLSTIQDLKQQLAQPAEPQNNSQISQHFMNYSRVSDISGQKQRKQLIQKCIQYESKQPQRIQTFIVQNWILRGGELKVM